MLKIIGLRVKEIREYRKLRGKDLAHMAGLSAAEISHIERGNRNPGVEIIERLAGALEVTLDYLVGKEDVDVPLVRGLARQSLRIYRRGAILTTEQEQYVLMMAESDSAPVTIEGWNNLLTHIMLWDTMRSRPES
jgi:transcriptional regulator with XRE-family HTH domain